MNKLIGTLITIWGCYVCVVLVVKYLNNFSTHEAKEKVNKAIVNFFSSSDSQLVSAILMLNYWEWKEMENVLKKYFNNVLYMGAMDNNDGTLTIQYMTAGFRHHYDNIHDEFIQTIVKEFNMYFLTKVGHQPSFFLRSCNGSTLIIIVAYNESGGRKINEYITAYNNVSRLPLVRKKLQIKFAHHKKRSCLYLGMFYQQWHQHANRLPIVVDLDTHPHLLLTGSTGSGKSYALKYYINQLICTHQIYDIWFGDFKNNTDFMYLSKFPIHYKTEDNVYQMVLDFFELFETVRRGGTTEYKKHVLIIEEYPSFLLKLRELGNEKEKRIKQIIGILLALGRDVRGYQFLIILTMQRPDASVFNSNNIQGVRDNFMIVVALGEMSNEGRRMVTSMHMEGEKNYLPGEGICKIDGRGTTEIIVPEIIYRGVFEEAK